ncbi:MAG: hypothetical protein IT335_11955, partial [Thermomicrobiales bacterium]|nr:hypothetical protein [Thermomicrobiales bacterium]
MTDPIERGLQRLSTTRRKFVTATGLGLGLSVTAPATFGALSSNTAGAQEASELLFGVSSDPVSMDPRVYPITIGFSILRHVYEPLAFRNDAMETVPVLAESWERIDDLTWEFRLRQGVTFHNGEEFNAASVQYTIDSLLSGENSWVNPQFGGYIAVIDEVEAVDDYTVRIHTSTPSNALVANLTLIGMLPPVAAADAGEDFTNVAVGTGPYRIDEYVANSHIALTTYEGYWGDPPASSQITFRILPEDATRLASLEAGEVHLVNNLPIDALSRFEESDETQVLSMPSNRILFVGWWNDKEPFTDIRVRQAFNHAIDKETINTALFGGLAQIATAPIHPSIRGYTEMEPYAY